MSKVEQIKQEQKKLQKSRTLNDPLDTYFAEKISILFAKLFYKLGFHPNVVTVFSMIVGVSGGALLAFHNLVLNIVGVILIILSGIFDCADGQVARLSGKGGFYGRCFDGFGDGLVYFAIYVGISVRLMSENIPFTDTPWSFWIWFISVPVGIYFHAAQARTADYYKQIWMYLTNNSHSEFSTSEGVKKQIDSLESKGLKHFICNSYLSYTKSQERMTPRFQELRRKIDANGGVIPEKVTEIWRKNSKFSIGLTNLLVFNFRTYLLFILLFCGVTFWIFPVNILVLEVIRIYLLVKYERLAKKCLKEGFDEI